MEYVNELKALYDGNVTTFTETCPSSQRHTTECLQRLAPKVFKDKNAVEDSLYFKLNFENYT